MTLLYLVLFKGSNPVIKCPPVSEVAAKITPPFVHHMCTRFYMCTEMSVWMEHKKDTSSRHAGRLTVRSKIRCNSIERGQRVENSLI